MDRTLNATQFAPAPRKYSQLPKLFRWFSEHCVLRSPEESDVMHIWNTGTHPHYARCWTGAVPRSLEEVAQLVHRALADWNRGTRYALTVQRKSTQEFVGWIELTAHATRRGAWLMQWFLHPRFVADTLAQESVAAAVELMFNTLSADTLYAQRPAAHAVFDQLLNNAGFIEVAPAGSLDAATQRPRSHAVFELGRADWTAMRRALMKDTQSPLAGPPTAPSWVTTGLRAELALI